LHNSPCGSEWNHRWDNAYLVYIATKPFTDMETILKKLGFDLREN